MLLLFVIYVFYTVPLNLTTSLLDPDKIDTVIPGYSNWVQNSGFVSLRFSSKAHCSFLSFVNCHNTYKI